MTIGKDYGSIDRDSILKTFPTLMHSITMEDSAISRIIGVIIQTVDPDTIILFGSRATGNNDETSDYDICVLKTGITERRKTAKMLYRALFGVGVPVDLLVETPENFNSYKTNPHLVYRDISQYGKVIYEKQGSR